MGGAGGGGLVLCIGGGPYQPCPPVSSFLLEGRGAGYLEVGNQLHVVHLHQDGREGHTDASPNPAANFSVISSSHFLKCDLGKLSIHVQLLLVQLFLGYIHLYLYRNLFTQPLYRGRVYKWKFCLSVHPSVCHHFLFFSFRL